MSANMLQCYNRGCGQLFDPEKNTDDSCCHHPGAPFFHDAYKGWSCCNKKSVDFTEFLNTRGCKVSKHSNEKPPEPEKPPKNVELPVAICSPIKNEAMERPDFDMPMLKLQPSVTLGLRGAIDALKDKKHLAGGSGSSKSGEIQIGTTCNNRGCSYSYTNTNDDKTECRHHPGHPIFHEGLKYWSCCQRKTSDFTAFVAQIGCANGEHNWVKEDDDKTVVNCR